MKDKITHTHSNKWFQAILMCCCMALISQHLVAQSPNSNAQAPWKLNGSQADSNQFVGTINNVDLIFKRNNIEGFRLNQDTSIKIMGNVILDKLKLPPTPIPIQQERILTVNPVGQIALANLTIPQDDTYVCLYTTPWTFADGTATDDDILLCPNFKSVTVGGEFAVFGKTGLGTTQNNNVQLNIQNYNNTIGIKLFNIDAPGNPPKYGIKNYTKNNDFIAYSVTNSGSELDVFRVMGDGKVGIGVGNSIPITALEVAGQITMRTGATAGYLPISDANGTMTWKDPASIIFSGLWQSNSPDIYFNTGNVGIGTTNPQAKLHVSGAGNQQIDISTTDPLGSYLRLMAVVSNNATEAQIQYKGKLRFVEPLSGITQLMIDENGITYAKELIVTITGFPDYVFAKNYQLKSLTEVEKFIKENNHLPDVPSEKEVKEKGINLGNMDALLLQKIEELTLYIIELEKRIKEVENK